MPYTITGACKGCEVCKKYCPVNAIEGERHAVHTVIERLCIECGACGKVCPYNTVIDGLGSGAEFIKIKQWPKPVWDYGLCVACKLCIYACPTGAVALENNSNGKAPPGLPYLIENKLCVACAFCDDCCPVDAIKMAQSPSQLGVRP
jgi:Na+-translocating ferredoxin:NAD+ oxidoreductase subunit B